MKNAPSASPPCAFNYPAFEEVANGEPERIGPTRFRACGPSSLRTFAAMAGYGVDCEREPERKSVNLVRRSASSLSACSTTAAVSPLVKASPMFCSIVTDITVSILHTTGIHFPFVQIRLGRLREGASPMSLNVEFPTSLLLCSSERQGRARLRAAFGGPFAMI